MPERGSEKLSHQLGSRCAFDEAQIQGVLEVLRQNDFKIIGWECRGQPRPDFFRGTVEVEARGLGRAVEILGTKLGQQVTLEAFPIGIPFPDIFQVNFQNLGHGG